MNRKTKTIDVSLPIEDVISVIGYNCLSCVRIFYLILPIVFYPNAPMSSVTSFFSDPSLYRRTVATSAMASFYDLWVHPHLYVVYLKSNRTDVHKQFISIPNNKLRCSSKKKFPLSLMHFLILLCHAYMHCWKDSSGMLLCNATIFMIRSRQNRSS